ncbi:hypothetical protein [Actinosynnema sp. NPDC023587]|uniref:hypothetical protein n=1 Tax=Actinosynnema sp. NPDC023587 TaxID=3154695 RepID=UPI0033F816CB
MRVLWAASGLAVAASALTGVLVGVYLDGVDDPQKAEPPSSTWITTRPFPSSGSSTPTSSTATTDPVVAVPRSTTSAPPDPTTTTPPPVPTTDPTTEAPAPLPTTPTSKRTDWPCGPLNPFPPPQCDD